MNKRIRELMIEAGYAAPELAGRAHKLVDLMIDEFAKICYSKQGQPEYNKGRMDCASEVIQELKH